MQSRNVPEKTSVSGSPSDLNHQLPAAFRTDVQSALRSIERTRDRIAAQQSESVPEEQQPEPVPVVSPPPPPTAKKSSAETRREELRARYGRATPIKDV